MRLLPFGVLATTMGSGSFFLLAEGLSLGTRRQQRAWAAGTLSDDHHGTTDHFLALSSSLVLPAQSLLGDLMCPAKKVEELRKEKAEEPGVPWTDLIRPLNSWGALPSSGSFLQRGGHAAHNGVASSSQRFRRSGGAAGAGAGWPLDLQNGLPARAFLNRALSRPEKGLFVFENFLQDEESEALIKLAGHGAAKVSRTKRSASGPDACTARRSETAWTWEAPDSVPSKVLRLLGNIERPHLEPLSVTRYPKGGFYSDHFDDLGPREQNPRMATVLLYLNDLVEDSDGEPGEKDHPSGGGGGGTYFPLLQARVLPRRGRAVVFFPTESGPLGVERNPWTRHCAEDAKATKWVAQQWVRKGAYDGYIEHQLELLTKKSGLFR